MSRSATGKAQSRNIVPSRWQKAYHSTNTKAFANPGILTYRNAVLSMLLHTPLFVNWIRGVHAEEDEGHLCNEHDMDLVCSLYRLISVYWLKDHDYQETPEGCVDLIWDKIRTTTWASIDVNKRQKPWVFLKKLLSQLRAEVEGNEKRYAQLERYFRSDLTWELPPIPCQGCGKEHDPRPSYVMSSLAASCPVNPPPTEASYDVAEAIRHELQLKTSAPKGRACDECGVVEKPAAEGTKIISHLPEVLFLRYDHSKVHIDYLKLEDKLTIPAELQENGPSTETFKYELQTIIFHFYEDFQKGDGEKRVGTDAFESDFDICAVREPKTGKWALIRSGSVENDLSLSQLLQIMNKVEKKHLTYALAYRHIPLTGPPEPTAGLSVLVKQTMKVREGLELTFHNRMDLPPEIKRLIELGPRQKKHHGHVKVMISSASTNERLEGETQITLGKRKADQEPPASATTSKRTRAIPSEKTVGSKSTAKTSAAAGPSKTAKAKKSTAKAAGSDAPESSRAAQSKSPKVKESKTKKDRSLVRAEASGTSKKADSSSKAKEAPSKRKRADDSAPESSADSLPKRKKVGESSSDKAGGSTSKKLDSLASEMAHSGSEGAEDSSSKAVESVASQARDSPSRSEDAKTDNNGDYLFKLFRDSASDLFGGSTPDLKKYDSAASDRVQGSTSDRSASPASRHSEDSELDQAGTSAADEDKGKGRAETPSAPPARTFSSESEISEEP
ncbi:hypothetical protein BDV06DRAFT_223539 [Aspergillus oleicola]